MTLAHYLRPRSLPEALEALAAHAPDAQVMAGGTIVMPMLNDGLIAPTTIISLRHAGLDAIQADGDGLRIGATATLSRVLAETDQPLLREAIRHTGNWAIRNMATIGGNLLTPSPGGDVAVALLALDASVTLAGPGGERTIALADLATTHGRLTKADDELLVSIQIPRADRDGGASAPRWACQRFARKAANTPAVVIVAARAVVDAGAVRDVRLALGGAAPYPTRARSAETLLAGQRLDPERIAAAAAAAARDSDPPTDAISSAAYRRRMLELFVGRALTELAGPVQGDGS